MATRIILCAAEPDPSFAPAVSWERVEETDRRLTLYPDGRPSGFIHTRLVVRDPNNAGAALFVCTGPEALLARLVTAVAGAGVRVWATLDAFRRDNSPPATRLRTAWPAEPGVVDENGASIYAPFTHRPMGKRNGDDPAEKIEDGES